MTNRIDQFTQYLADNPLSSRVSNRERTTVNPLARQLTTAQTLSLDTTVAAVTLPDTVPPVTLIPDQGSAVITADPQDLERIKQELIADSIQPILAALSAATASPLLTETVTTAEYALDTLGYTAIRLALSPGQNTALTLGTAPVAGTDYQLRLYVTYAEDSVITGWLPGTLWAQGNEPTQTAVAGKTDLFELITHDGAVTWFARVLAQNF
jgi:hypothetical protein